MFLPGKYTFFVVTGCKRQPISFGTQCYKKCFHCATSRQKRPQWASSKDQLWKGVSRIRLMHALGTAQLLHQGSGVWGDKSQVLFVNDKAIISLVLHREKKNLTAKIQTRIPRETTKLIGWTSFSFPSQEQTNEPLRATEQLRQSYHKHAGNQLPHKSLVT